MKRGALVLSMLAMLILFYYSGNVISDDSIPLKTSGASYSCENCTDCQQKIDGSLPGDLIMLSSNITAVGHCINLTSHLTFDCDGYSLIGPHLHLYEGIRIVNAENVTVRDCPTIQSFREGIHVINSNYTRIINVTFRNITNIAVWSLDSYHGVFHRVSMYDNEDWGIYFRLYGNMTVTDLYGEGGAGITLYFDGGGMVATDYVTLRNASFKDNWYDVMFDTGPHRYQNISHIHSEGSDYVVYAQIQNSSISDVECSDGERCIQIDQFGDSNKVIEI